MSNEKPFVSVIIAALNEEDAIAGVINAVPRNVADEIVVVDNGSKDRTAEIAAAAGAHPHAGAVGEGGARGDHHPGNARPSFQQVAA